MEKVRSDVSVSAFNFNQEDRDGSRPRGSA